MAQRGYDAVRHSPDLRCWLTDAERTFDEQAHTAFITQDELFMHTDSRYYNLHSWSVLVLTLHGDDQEVTTPTKWVAAHVAEARARVVAIVDTQLTLRSLMALSRHCVIALLLLCFHVCMAMC